jgi:hypothetical protein
MVSLMKARPAPDEPTRDQRAPRPVPASPPAAALLALQRSAGNAAVSRAILARNAAVAAAILARDANFDTVGAAGGVSETAAPLTIKLPKEFSEGLAEAYDESFPGGHSQEQIGLLVQKNDGAYAWKRSATPGDSGSATPNYSDLGADERLIAVAHTHPYDKSEGGHKGVSFSADDLFRLVQVDERMAIVNAGTKEFVAVKTAEWDTMVSGLDAQGKQDLMDEMEALWDKTFKATNGKLAVRADAATKAVCEKYHLLYYSGDVGGDLTRRTQKRVLLKPVTGFKAVDDALHALGIGSERA